MFKKDELIDDYRTKQLDTKATITKCSWQNLGGGFLGV